MANGEFKKCLNGHYYQGATCPYCKGNSQGGGNPTNLKTEAFIGGGGNTGAKTEAFPGGGASSTGTKTQVYEGFGGDTNGYTQPYGSDGSTVVAPKQGRPANRTVFGGEEESLSPDGQPTYRETRKLVGWLVSYTLDTMGVDFKLYEGRNIIGRGADCSISINDNMVSAKHSTLLFKAGRYAIKDEMSSHGTIVNGNDIGLDPCYLQDGDEIKMGNTVFKFRTSF